MTEEDWNACTNPQPMVEFLRGKASDRTLRLFACACCRRIWHLLDDQRLRDTVELAERMADQHVEVEEINRAERATLEAGAGVGSVEDAVMMTIDRYRANPAPDITASAAQQHFAWKHHPRAPRGRSERYFAYWWREELSERTR